MEVVEKLIKSHSFLLDKRPGSATENASWLFSASQRYLRMPPNDPIKASNRFFDTMRAAPPSCSSIYPLKGNENGGHKVGRRFLSKKERTISTGPLGIKNKVSRPLFYVQ